MKSEAEISVDEFLEEEHVLRNAFISDGKCICTREEYIVMCRAVSKDVAQWIKDAEEGTLLELSE